MKNRRSIRDFSNKNFSRELLEKILVAGFLSPSGANQKPFAYIIIDNPAIKKEIKDHCEEVDKKFFSKSKDWFKKWMKERQISLEKKFLVDAPYLIICAGKTNKPYWLESTWLSIAYVILAAENEGLATLTYTPGDMEFLHDLIDLPSDYEPVVILPIGYPMEKVSKTNTNIKKKIFFNKYGSE